MANHRAEKPPASRRRSTDSKGKAPRTPTPRSESKAPRTPAPRSESKAARTRVPDSTGTAARTPAATGGKRKAAKNTSRSGGRRNPLSALPSPPSLVGAAAVALAAVGAVTISGTGLGSQFASGAFQKEAAQASVLNGASSIGSSDALSGRQRAVSRDSERQALQDAADQRLQAAAEAQAKQRNAALAALAASAQKHANLLAQNAWQLPIPLGAYHLTAGFGQCSLLWSHCHTGLDFAAPAGTPIHAIAAGVVTDVGWAGAYGNRTIVTLSDGTELWYAHQTSFNVSIGEHVSGGQIIGSVGATGNVTGPHLHVEVRPGGGDPVDPYNALVAHGLNLGDPNPA